MIEKERKFLLKEGVLPEGLKGYKIKQAYLMVEPGQHLRVRITNDGEAKIAYKIFINDRERYEYEYTIPMKDALEMYEAAQYKLTKKRYPLIHPGASSVYIDLYPSGLKIVEIEYEDELTSLPAYCGKEITGDDQYSNITIAQNNDNKSNT